MLLLLTALLIVSPALAIVQPEPEPEDIAFERYHEIRRSASHHLPCPDRAVCGVAFDFNRTVGGVRYPERRVIFNCKCGGETECPIRAANRIYTSMKKREYLCQPLRTLLDCNNPNRRRMRLQDRPAKTLVFGSEEFDYVPFTRINCLCPRHLRPVQPRSRFDLPLATAHGRYRHIGGVNYEFRSCVEN